MGALKLAIAALFPNAPALVRQQAWLARVLVRLGVIAPRPEPRPAVAPITGEVSEAYLRAGFRYFVTDRLCDLQDRDVAKEMAPFLQSISGSAPPENLADQVKEFRSIYRALPCNDNSGGANFTSGLALFLIARHLKPQQIIESGVLRGMSSMIMKAAVPSATIDAFDLNLSALHPTEGVRYHQRDWTSLELYAKPSSLVYFDDHVNQAQRIIEAHARGFRHLLFDDSWSWGAISGCGGVPLPSIDMIMADDLKVGERAEWFEDGELMTYEHTAEAAKTLRQAHRLIDRAEDVPVLYRQTGVAPTSALKFVKLVD